MGLHLVPTVDHYWSSDPLFRVQPVTDLMPIKRFNKLLQALHFDNNRSAHERNHPNYDKLHKVRPLLIKLNVLFSNQCVQSSSQSIDDEMILFKVRSSLKQYMQLKPVKRG